MSDLSGFSRLGRNVFVSWSAYVFVLLTGFIIPRQISDYLGPASLGVWDLGWATVRYLSLANFGVGGSVARYIALYRAEGSSTRLAESTTAISIIQGVVAVATASIAFVAALLIVDWIDMPDTVASGDAVSVLFILGLSVSVRMFGNPAGGILAGCHRSDIQHSINAAQDVLMALSMISVLVLGGGLVELALSVFLASLAITVFRIYLARRVCPEAIVSFRHWRLSRGLEMLKFGAKSTLIGAPDVLVFQTVILFLAGAVGPVAVAILSRGMALIRHCEHLVRRTATMFVPITSSLVGLDRKDDARDMVIKIGGYGLALTLPLMLVLLNYGDIVLRLWMGDSYANKAMLTALVAGSIVPVSQMGTMSVLAGLNAHGRLAVASLIVSLVVLLVGVPLLNYYGWSVVAAAALVGTSWTVGRGLVIPVFLKLRFDIGVLDYFVRSLLKPLLLNVPLAFALYWSRRFFDAESLWLSAGCLIGGSTATALIYWYSIIPAIVKKAVRKKLAIT